MSRLPELRYEDMTAEQQRIHDEIESGPRGTVEGPLKVWLHAPSLADKAQKLEVHARFHSALPPALSELAILVTAQICAPTTNGTPVSARHVRRVFRNP